MGTSAMGAPRAVLPLTESELRLLAGAMDAATIQGSLALPYAQLRLRLEQAIQSVSRPHSVEEPEESEAS